MRVRCALAQYVSSNVLHVAFSGARWFGRWNWDGHETFGGISRMALIHHICIKPADGQELLGEAGWLKVAHGSSSPLQ